MLSLIQKIPVVTTLLTAGFFFIIYNHWESKGKPSYLFWWTFGILSYGLGTLTESWVGLFGWNVVVFKAWYILGALLGGFPLAQGSVFLFFKHRTAKIMATIVSSIILIASILVILSPVDYSLVEPTRLTGRVLEWKNVRLITPIVNIYAFIFLVGGASVSAYRYSKDYKYKNRFFGNVLIALGGLLPGIGGSFTKFGYTEVLYVCELIGIILIYAGYKRMRQDSTISLYETQTQPGNN
jgi:hypothetical protein